MDTIEKHHTFNGSHKKVFNGLSAYELYPSYIKGVKATKLMNPKDPAASCGVHYQLNLIKTFSYKLDMYHEQNKKISWVLRDSNFFSHNSGSWTLEPYGENYTKVVYLLKIGFTTKIPSFITKKLTESSLPMMFKDFQSLINSLKS